MNKFNFYPLINIGLIVITLVIAYFSIKSFFKNQYQNDLKTTILLNDLKLAVKNDSIKNVKIQQSIDSLSKVNNNLLEDIEYIRKQNDAINARNKKIIDNYNNIVINRPDF